MSIPSNLIAASGIIKVGTVPAVISGFGAVDYTMVYTTAANPQAGLPNRTTLANAQPAYVDLAQMPSLADYDEVYVHITNMDANPPVGGGAVAVSFAWRDGNAAGFVNGVIFEEMAYEQAPSTAEVSAIVAGYTTASGVAKGVRRYPADVAEFGPIAQGEGRTFPLRLKHQGLLIGLRALAAPNNVQIVVVQLVPRIVGVARGSGS